MFNIEALSRAKHAALVRNADRQAPVQEALLERSRLAGQDRFSVFARFAAMLSLRPKVTEEAAEAPSSACLRARRWFSLSLDGELAESDQAALMDHLFMTHIENCTACSSFQAVAGASTALLRETPPETPPLPIGVLAADATAPEQPGVAAG
jgi:hypothetical protein